jgi:2,3-diaminopropionate biosynthesis protein SbnA
MQTSILNKVGNTPMVAINAAQHIHLFAKLEFYNPTGSVKDRAASYIIRKALETGIINNDTILVESSSGNFGVALAAYARLYGLKFICVIDKNTSPVNESIIRSYGAQIIKITEPDEYGGYLLNRIERIKGMLLENNNMYWINQYESLLNAEAYFDSLGMEICNEAPQQAIDYVFMGVSSGGTITGVSRKIKDRFPKANVIAVDIVGSVIFGGAPAKRHIPGIGSSMRPKILNNARIDDVVWVSEIETVEGCRELLREHYLCVGGSSGSVYAAIKKYFSLKNITRPVNVITVFPDRGDRYMHTIYNDEWYNELQEIHRAEMEFAY